MSKSIDNADFEKSNNQIIQNKSNRSKIKKLLDQKGCGFCLAKWTQVTMHLGAGLTHSCHHVGAHQIPLDELKDNPGALHNTSYKKSVRKQMLNNKRPDECDYCWRIEDNTSEFSDRIYKSLGSYSIYDYDDIVNFSGDEDFYPRYVEVSFSNVCNFKCSYCGPTFSSKWVEELKQHGEYILPGHNYNLYNQKNITNNSDNPYIEAFWEWFPEAINHMHTFRVTGGEPLLSKHTFRVIEYLIKNPQPGLEFAINTNGCPPDQTWIEFVKLLQILEQKKCVKDITVFVSAESTGSQAEYSRYGMNWQQFVKNIEILLDSTSNVRVSFMSAFNILSLPTFYDFLEYVLFLKEKYNKSKMFNNLSNIIAISNTTNSRISNRVSIDIPYVRHPDFLDIKIANDEMIEKYLFPCVVFMHKNASHHDWNGNKGFENHEIEKLKRILLDCVNRIKKINLGDKNLTKDQLNSRIRFFNFISEYDKRRFLKFSEVFPEYVDFLNECQKSKLDI